MFIQSTFFIISITEEVNYDIDSDCKITLTFNYSSFIIFLLCYFFWFFDKFNSIEYTYLNRLDNALKLKNLLEVDITLKEISDFIAILCQPIFKKFASTIRNKSQELDLDFYINLKTYNLQQMTVNRKPKIIRYNSNGNNLIYPIFSSLLMQTAVANLN